MPTRYALSSMPEHESQTEEQPKKGRTYARTMTADERAAEQRERIIDATTALYGEKGYYETRLEDIVARAQVSRRTLYAHFRDLGELHFAVYERAMSQTLLKLGEIAQDPTPRDRLKAVLTMLFGAIVENPQLSRAVVYELRLPEPKNVALRQQVLSFFCSLLLEGTRDDFRNGLCSKEPDELTVYAMLGVFEGLALKYVDGSEPSKALDAVPIALAAYRAVYPFHLPDEAVAAPPRP